MSYGLWTDINLELFGELPTDSWSLADLLEPSEGTTELEDCSLDLSAYYQTLENLASWLRAHDGLEFDDLAASLEAAGYSLENLTLSLEAFAQSLVV